MALEWRFFLDPRLWAALTSGAWMTIKLTLFSSAGALLVGIAITVVRLFGGRLLRNLAELYTNVVRDVPLLIQLFFFYFGISMTVPATEFPFLRSEYFGQVVTILTISLAMGGFVAELIRAGIEAVPVGQVETALAGGLTRYQVYRYVVAPQLLPIVLPGLSSEIVNVLKGTTFAMTIGVADLMWQAQSVESETFRGLETMTAITVAYFVLGIAIIFAFRRLENFFHIPAPK